MFITKPLVIIESPCAPSAFGSWEEHQDYLKRCLRDSIERGEAPIASHGLFAFSNVFDDANSLDRKRCMEAGWAWMRGANIVAVYADYGISEGMQQGMQYAAEVRRVRDLPTEMRYIGTNDQPLETNS